MCAWADRKAVALCPGCVGCGKEGTLELALEKGNGLRGSAEAPAKAWHGVGICGLVAKLQQVRCVRFCVAPWA